MEARYDPTLKELANELVRRLSDWKDAGGDEWSLFFALDNYVQKCISLRLETVKLKVIE